MYQPHPPEKSKSSNKYDKTISITQLILQNIATMFVHYFPPFNPNNASSSKDALWTEHIITIDGKTFTFHTNKTFDSNKDTIIFLPPKASYQYFKFPKKLFEKYNVVLLHYHVKSPDGTIPEYDIFDRVFKNTQKMIPQVIDTLKTLYDAQKESSINSRIILMGYCYGSMLALKHVAAMNNKDEPYKYILSLGSPMNYYNTISKLIFLPTFHYINRIFILHMLCYSYIFYDGTSIKSTMTKFIEEYRLHYLFTFLSINISAGYILLESYKVGITEEDLDNLNNAQPIYSLNGPDPECTKWNIREKIIALVDKKNYEPCTQQQLTEIFARHQNVKVLKTEEYMSELTDCEKQNLYDDPHYGLFSQQDSSALLKILNNVIEPDIEKKQRTTVEESTVSTLNQKQGLAAQPL